MEVLDTTYWDAMTQRQDKDTDSTDTAKDMRIKGGKGEMVTCGVCDCSPESQKNGCSEFEKASYERRCMYLHFNEYCDKPFTKEKS